MRAADIVPYEQVQVVNVNNGARFETYCIEGTTGSGVVCVNGAAARLAVEGDTIIVISYAQMTEEEREGFAPKLVFVDEQNHVKQIVSEDRSASSPHGARPFRG